MSGEVAVKNSASAASDRVSMDDIRQYENELFVRLWSGDRIFAWPMLKRETIFHILRERAART